MEENAPDADIGSPSCIRCVTSPIHWARNIADLPLRISVFKIDKLDGAVYVVCCSTIGEIPRRYPIASIFAPRCPKITIVLSAASSGKESSKV
jgi:hypothetical protein